MQYVAMPNPEQTISDMPSDGLNVQERNESRMPAEFSLRQGLGVWELTFAGEKAILRHEQGLAYVGWLLAHPGESILALDLVTQVAAANREHGGMAEIVDPATGRRLALQSDARLQERALSLDAKTMRTVLRRQEELEALVEQDDEVEPVKEEAYRELIALYDYEKRNGTRVRDGAAKRAGCVVENHHHPVLKALCQFARTATRRHA